MGTHCWGSETSPAPRPLFPWEAGSCGVCFRPGHTTRQMVALRGVWWVGGVGLLFEMWIVDASIIRRPCPWVLVGGFCICARQPWPCWSGSLRFAWVVLAGGSGWWLWCEFLLWRVVRRRRVALSWSLVDGVGVVWCWWRQAVKGTWWMPWHREPMKDVGACDKPWGVGNRAVIRGCPNGETQLESCPVTCA